jgi:hypothetical protein
VGSGINYYHIKEPILDCSNFFAAVVQTEHTACDTDSLTAATAATTEGFGH